MAVSSSFQVECEIFEDGSWTCSGNTSEFESPCYFEEAVASGGECVEDDDGLWQCEGIEVDDKVSAPFECEYLEDGTWQCEGEGCWMTLRARLTT
jgi:hypothetical protein